MRPTKRTRRGVRGGVLMGMLAVGLALALGFASSADAYEFLGATWPLGTADLWLNPNFADTALAGDADHQEAILLCGANAWREQSRTNFDFHYRGRTTVRRLNDRDGVNAVFYSDSDGGEALAVTLFSFDEDVAEAFDVAFFASTDGVENGWSGLGEPQAGTFDIQGVITHELGHALGLDHSLVTGATMTPYAVGRGLPLRTLAEDDRSGVESLYGLRTQSLPLPEIASLSPESGPMSGGNEVLVSGANFTYDSDTELRVDGSILSPAAWDTDDCGTLRILAMPAHAPGRVSISLRNAVGESTSADVYEYLAAPPTITLVEPSLGALAGGTLVVVHGTNFTEDSVVTIGGALLESPVVVDAETIRGAAPPATVAGPAAVRVVAAGGEFALESGFTYVSEAVFLRGDVQKDGVRDLTDAVRILTSLFQGGDPLPCEDAADSNDDGTVDLSDAVKILLYLFIGGETLPEPSLAPGVDPTADELGCEG